MPPPTHLLFFCKTLQSPHSSLIIASFLKFEKCEILKSCFMKCDRQLHRRRKMGDWGHVPLQDFAMNKEVPFLFKKCPLFLEEKSALEVSCPSKFEMLPTSLTNCICHIWKFLMFRSFSFLRFLCIITSLVLLRFTWRLEICHSSLFRPSFIKIR